jgi:hypothetical protein
MDKELIKLTKNTSYNNITIPFISAASIFTNNDRSIFSVIYSFKNIAMVTR